MKNLAVFFGGRSVEHDVSIITGTQFIENADQSKYTIMPVYIARDGKWYCGAKLKEVGTFKNFNPDDKEIDEVFLYPVPDKGTLYKKGKFGLKPVFTIDVAVIAMHGMHGEDGTIQGIFEMADIPYTSPGVTGSAVGMDKIVMKAAFKGLGFPVLDSCYFERSEILENTKAVMEKVEACLPYPVFVKPANLGSSIGISKAKDAESLERALLIASNYDRRVLVERAVTDIMEINCAVLGVGGQARASLCEQPVTWKEFLTFDEKYLRGSGPSKGMKSLTRKIPADIPKEMEERIKNLSLEIFKAFDLKGVVRIDYIIDQSTGELFVNETNTIPGSFAFYLFEPDGLSYKELIDVLIEDAIRQMREKEKNVFAYDSDILKKTGLGAKGTK